MKKIFAPVAGTLLFLFSLSLNAQNNFPNGVTASKGTSFSGSAVFSGSTYASHFHYSTTEDTYIRGGKPASNIYVGDVGTNIYLGNTNSLVNSYGLLSAFKGLNVTSGIYATKNANVSGSAVFVGSEYASHFHYSATEDTYIRGGKSTSNVFINDVGAKVVIGSVSFAPAGYKLFVEQGILTEKVKVAVRTSADWADHVFNKDYPLMPIEQVAAFVQKNNHLPGIPSAAEVVNNGIDLGKMNAKLLEKIEELTLYIIQLNKKVEQLESGKNAGLATSIQNNH